MKTILSTLILSLLCQIPMQAQSSSFSYQGRLQDGGLPANGLYDLQFTLFDASSGGASLGSVGRSGTSVVSGLFATTLDFGTNAFGGADRWVEISVRTNGVGNFAILGPRQAISPTPYAIHAATATSLSGPIPETQLSTNIAVLNKSQSFTGSLSLLGAVSATNAGNIFAGKFTGDASGLTNLVIPNPASNSIGTLQLQNQSVTGVKIADGTIPLTKLAAQVLTTNDLAGLQPAGTYPALNGAGNLVIGGSVTASQFSGSGSGLTNIPAASVVGLSGGNFGDGSLSGSKLLDGTVTPSKLSQTYLTPSDAINFQPKGNYLGVDVNGSTTVSGTMIAGNFSGSGAGLTSLNATRLTSGQVGDSLLSVNIARLAVDQRFTGSNYFAGPIGAAKFSGDGSGLTNLAIPPVVGLSGSAIGDGAIVTAKLGDASVTTAKLVDASVTTAKLTDGSVTPAKLSQTYLATNGAGDATVIGNLTAKKVIGDGSGLTNLVMPPVVGLSGSAIGDGAIVTAKLGDASVSTAKLVDGSVTTAKLADGAITPAKLSQTYLATNGAGDATVIGNLTAKKVIGDGSGLTNLAIPPVVGLSGSAIGDGAIVTAKLGDASVTTAKLVDASVTTAKLADGSVTPAKLSQTYLATNSTGDATVIGNLTAKKVIGDGSGLTNLVIPPVVGLSGSAIGDGAIVTAKLGDASVSTAKLVDASVTTAKLADGAITPAKLSASYLTTSAASTTYQPVGNYLTTSSAASTYLTLAGAAASYQPIGSYLTTTEGSATLNGSLTANLINGGGSGLSNLQASALVGTLSDNRLSSQVVRTDLSQQLAGNYTFSGANTFTGTNIFSSGSNTFVGNFSGDGHGLSNVVGAASINTSQVADGAITPAKLSTAYQPAGSYLTTSAAGMTYQPIGSYLTLSGSSATLAGNVTANQFNGSGAGLSGVPASSLTGTLSDSRLGAHVARTDIDQVLAGNYTFNGANTFLGTNIFSSGSNTFVGNFAGDGHGLSNVVGAASINTSQVADGAITPAKLSTAYQPAGSYLTTSAAGMTYQPIGSYLTLSGSSATLAGNVTANQFNGSGAGLSGVPASALTGTLSDTRLSSHVVRTDLDQTLAGNYTFTGTNTFLGTNIFSSGSNVFVGSFSGDGHGLSNVVGAASINTSQVADGAITPAKLSTAYQPAGSYLTLSGGSATLAGNVTANQFNGSGAGLSGVPASSLTGTLSDSRLGAHVARTDIDQVLAGNYTFNGANTFLGTNIFSSGSNTFVGNFAGDGHGLSNVVGAASINTSQVADGAITPAKLSTAYQPAGSYLTTSAAGMTYQPIGSYLTLSGGSATLAGNVTANQFNGSGAGLSGVPASALTGTLSDTRLSSHVMRTDLDQTLAGNYTFTGTNTFLGTNIFSSGSNAFVGSFTGDASGLTNLNFSSVGALSNIHVDGTTVIGGPIQSSDGDKRGFNANDFQTARYDGSHVASGSLSVIGGGQDNEASGSYTVVSGGRQNGATDTGAFVGGGYMNSASGEHSVVAGGENNVASGPKAGVLGGEENEARGEHSAIAGGWRNMAAGDFSGVGAGADNRTDGSYSLIAGGNWNNANSDFSTIAGGSYNVIDGVSSVIVGGEDNYVKGTHVFIGGGEDNYVGDDYHPGDYSVVVGGQDNSIQGAYSAIGGGSQNSINGQYSVIGGGVNNALNSSSSGFIGGGSGNALYDSFAVIGGGRDNVGGAQMTFIGGGNNNEASDTGAAVLGGSVNSASGGYSTVLGGAFNLSAGLFSMTAGYQAQSVYDGSFVWSDFSDSNTVFRSTAENQFLIRAAGGVGINKTDPHPGTLDVGGEIRGTSFVSHGSDTNYFTNPVKISNANSIIKGNGAGLTSLAGGNISAGTIPASALTDTYIPVVDGSASIAGVFAASNFVGNISSTSLVGMVSTTVLPASVVLTTANQTFIGTNTFNGTNVFAGITTITNAGNTISGAISGTISGNGAGLTALNASQLTSGTVPLGELPASVVLTTANQTFIGTNTFNGTNVFAGITTITNAGNTISGAISGTISGNGAGLTTLNASQLTSGTVPVGELPASVVLTTANQTFIGTNTFNGTNVFAGITTITNAGNTISGAISGTISGNGAGLTALNASQLTSGTVPVGELPASVVLTTANQTFIGTNTFNGTNVFAGITTITNAGNTIRGAISGTISGNGSGLTALNASQLTSGIVPVGELPASVALTNANQTFYGTNTFVGISSFVGNTTFGGSNFFGGVVHLTNASNIFIGDGHGLFGLADLSDRNAKENFTKIDPKEILGKVAAMDITSWNYKTEDRSVRHLGPMAQDFYGAFKLGDSDLRIPIVDGQGISLAAIQGLNQVVVEQKAELKQKEAQIDALEKRLSDLESKQAERERRLSAMEKMLRKSVGDASPETAAR